MLESSEVLLRCVVCRTEKSFNLTRTQKRQVAEGGQIQFHCSFCESPQFWEAARPVQITDRGNSDSAEPKHILVVDDDELTVKLLRKVLEAWNARVEVAQNGKEALAKLAANDFDMLVCDIRMPEMTGQELFQHIQDNAYLPPQRILFLTGERSAAVKQFLDGSGSYYLYKPLQFLDFSDQVQAVLSGEPVE
jgi:CheY-like chemotaxis protein